MATTEPRRKTARTLPFPDRVALIFADRHWHLVEYARGLADGNESFAEDWVAGAYVQALTQEDQLAHRDDGFIVMRLHDHIRAAARVERERRKSAAHPHPAAPTVLNSATGGARDLAEQIAERAEANIYAKAFFGLSDSRGRRAVVLRVLGHSYAEIAKMIGARDAADARMLAHRARQAALRAAEPLLDGTACRGAQLLMQAALEGRLSAKKREQLKRHMAETDCACGRIFRLMEHGTDLRRLRALVPPALMLPAAGGAADAGIAEAGLHGFLGLSRLTYVNEMAGAHQFIAWAGDLLAWVGRPGALVSALALIPVGIRRGPGRWVAVALSAVAVLFLAGGLLHGFPGASGDPPPAGRPGAASSGASAPLDPMAGLVAQQTGRLIDAASARVRRLQRATEIATARSLSAATQARTTQAAWQSTSAAERAPSAGYQQVSTPAAAPAPAAKPLPLDDAFTPWAAG